MTHFAVGNYHNCQHNQDTCRTCLVDSAQHSSFQTLSSNQSVQAISNSSIASLSLESFSHKMLRVLQPQDSDHVCLFAAELFDAHEPMTRVLSTTVPDLVQLYTPIVEACCSSGLSFIIEEAAPASAVSDVTAAQDRTSTSRIMSVCLALPYATYKSLPWPEVPSARPAGILLKSMPQIPAEQEATAVYAFLWGTHSNHMGKGYLKKVLTASIPACRQAGYTSMVADLTNVVSQGLALKRFGFNPLEPKIRYHDHESFRGVEGTEFIIRAVKGLTDDN